MSCQSFATITGIFVWKEQMKADCIYIIKVRKVTFSFKPTGNLKADRQKVHKGIDIVALCDILDTVKGSKQKNIKITYITAPADPNQELLVNKTYMVFLKKGGRKLIPVNRYHSFVLLPGYVFCNQKLSPRKALEYQVNSLLYSGSAKKIESAFGYYEKYTLTAPQKRLFVLLTNKLKDIKYNALLLLLKARNKEAAKKIDTMIKDNSFSKIPRKLRILIAYELQNQPKVMISEEACIALASSEDKVLKYIGAYISRKIGTPKSLPVLLKAIDSKDESTQQSAYIAISKITGKKHYYGTELFKKRKNEAIKDAKQRAKKMIEFPNSFKKKSDDDTLLFITSPAKK